jgi:hypothetical protein
VFATALAFATALMGLPIYRMDQEARGQVLGSHLRIYPCWRVARVGRGVSRMRRCVRIFVPQVIAREPGKANADSSPITRSWSTCKWKDRSNLPNYNMNSENDGRAGPIGQCTVPIPRPFDTDKSTETYCFNRSYIVLPTHKSSIILNEAVRSSLRNSSEGPSIFVSV